MLTFMCTFWSPDEDTHFPRTETSGEILKDLPGENILPLGGGGGTFGGTLVSRLEEPIHTMDAAQAADTGGVANDPVNLLPVDVTGLRKDEMDIQERADAT